MIQPLTQLVLVLSTSFFAESCTNLLVTPSASADGSAIIAYNADSPQLFGYLYHYPATSGVKDTMRKVYEWDTGKYLGEIPEEKSTYNVVGNTNSEGLVIAETTFGGIEILASQTGAIIDYGSLIYLTLQRSSNATEAISTMVNLMDTYGYASAGESFSIADYNGDVWMMEVIGRGEGKKGAVWVAVRIPNGSIAAHANQARITTFPRDDPDNCLYSDDVVTLARDLGLYEGTDEEFSFSDTYDPLNFHGVRYGESRVWSLFSKISNDPNFQEEYLDYVSGANYKHRMPLYITPKTPISLSDVTLLFSDHYENTPLSPEVDVGSGMHHVPYRPYPIVWNYKNKEYFNERTIATPKTGWSFIAQIRFHVPKELSSILWFAADESSTSPRFPIYGCSTSIPEPYSGFGPQDGSPSPILKFDLSKAFWVQNLVANFAYSRWSDIFPSIQSKIQEIQKAYEKEIPAIDAVASYMYYRESKSSAIDFVTEFSNKAGKKLHDTWYEFFGEIFTKYRDGYTIKQNDEEKSCNCQADSVGFDDDWKKSIVDETGMRYEVPSNQDKEDKVELFKSIDKWKLKSMK